MPSSVLVLPIRATLTGAILTMGWSWPMPWASSSFSRFLYLFFLTRWQFDFIANSVVSRRVLNLGADTWARIDKGVLELLGPRGLTNFITGVAAPKIRQWQTGIVHDYALIFQFAILAGFLLLLLPGGMVPNLFGIYDPRTIGAVIFLIRCFNS